MIDDYSSPSTSTTKNDIQDYNCVLFWISEQDGVKSNICLFKSHFPHAASWPFVMGFLAKPMLVSLPDQSFSKRFNRKLAFARIFVVPCKTAVQTKWVQSLTRNAAPLFPKNNKNRSLENFAQTFLPFPAFLFPVVWWNWTRICGATVTLIGIHVHINIYIYIK